MSTARNRKKMDEIRIKRPMLAPSGNLQVRQMGKPHDASPKQGSIDSLKEARTKPQHTVTILSSPILTQALQIPNFVIVSQKRF